MAPKIFLTGTTGYIGGDFISVVSERHPDWDLTCLVRNSDKGAKIAAVYPKIRLVYGDLDAVETIEEEAAKADIVYNFANCDHEAAANAIVRGLAQRESPAYLIHTSGTMILAWETIQLAEYGTRLEKVFDDSENVKELTSQPDQAAHRDVDKIILAAGSEKVKTAIVCPPTIWGQGRGPDNTRSVQIYRATEAFLKRGKGFKVGKGENIWHQIHVADLTELYVLLGEAALNNGSPATWNDQGYYLAENGPFVWGEVLDEIAKVAHKKGLLQDAAAESLSPQDAEACMRNSRYSIGTNSRGVSLRAKELLGWKPVKGSIMDELATAVDSEARLLGLTQGHAVKAAEEDV